MPQLELRHYEYKPHYEGLSFESTQRVTERMLGFRPTTWDELIEAPGVSLTPNIDLKWLQRTGGTHYIWKNGWRNVDQITIDQRGNDGRICPPFEERRPRHFKILRQREPDQVVELGLDYVLPDPNEHGYKELMGVLFRKDNGDNYHKMVSRMVMEYATDWSLDSLVSTLGAGFGVSNGDRAWNEPRYKKAFYEMMDLLGISSQTPFYKYPPESPISKF